MGSIADKEVKAAGDPNEDKFNLLNFLNDSFAEACGDLKTPEKADPSEGPARISARVLLVLAVAVAILAAAVASSLGSPSLYTQRILEDDFTTEGKDVFNISCEGSIVGLGAQGSRGGSVADISCPCRNKSVVWPSFTNWYLVEDASMPNTPLKDIDAFCAYFADAYSKTQHTTNISSSGGSFQFLCEASFGVIIGRADFSPAAGCFSVYPTEFPGAVGGPIALGGPCPAVAQIVETNFLMDFTTLNVRVTQRLSESLSSSVLYFESRIGTMDAKALAAYTAMYSLVSQAIQLNLQTRGKLLEGDDLVAFQDIDTPSSFGHRFGLGMKLLWEDYF